MRAPSIPRDVHDAIVDPSLSIELCESDRLVLFQHYVELRTIDEIAASFRVVPRLVRQRLNRALRSVQRALSAKLVRLGREAHCS